MWPEIGELLFSVVVGYMGAIELFFVFRQIYHLAFQHEKRLELANDAESLKKLQDQIDKEITEAAKNEKFGFKAMKDGVLYKDGFRVDPEEIDSLEKIPERQVIGGSDKAAEKESRSESAKRELGSESSHKQEVCEEPCVKKEVRHLTSEQPKAAENERTNLTQTVKTQFGQTNLENYMPTVESERNKLALGISEDSSSTEPLSLQSSLSNQKSSSLETSEVHFDEYEREAPDGEDVPEQQYSDEYLRSLDGIKHRPLVRDDGSGRRRAFKKRRSSESTSSRESRASREEELKMFTSLEEEESEAIKKGESEYAPIKYSSDSSLKVGKHRRRHRKSPVKDSKLSEEEENEKESLKTFEEEDTNPWGDVKPENYKNLEFWKREKELSIEEENEENTGNFNRKNKDIQRAEQVTTSPSPTKNIPKMSSFEEATRSQYETVVSALGRQSSKDTKPKERGDSELNKMGNLIFSGEYTKAMNKDWHSGHFCCWQCDESLTGQRYVIRDDHPYCIKCYENVFANTCEECRKIIGIDSKDLSYKDKHWHEACFLCSKCRISLVDKQFGAKADKIYCGNCYDAQFASRCDGCGEVFRAGTKKMEYKTRQWHEKCFCCCVCKTPIGTKSFIPREQEIYCAGCYEEKFATRCIKCNKIITAGGVTYKNEPWHRECFTCTHCNTTLAGQRFTSRDEKPYCADCFGELFAKRCTSCAKPITGIGGTRFISFEDRHWHHDCFICASCKTSLVGRGFITDGPDIICPECAKQKLM